MLNGQVTTFTAGTTYTHYWPPQHYWYHNCHTCPTHQHCRACCPICSPPPPQPQFIYTYPCTQPTPQPHTTEIRNLIRDLSAKRK